MFGKWYTLNERGRFPNPSVVAHFRLCFGGFLRIWAFCFARVSALSMRTRVLSRMLRIATMIPSITSTVWSLICSTFQYHPLDMIIPYMLTVVNR